jgi:hypothetical protein
LTPEPNYLTPETDAQLLNSARDPKTRKLSGHRLAGLSVSDKRRLVNYLVYGGQPVYKALIDEKSLLYLTSKNYTIELRIPGRLDCLATVDLCAEFFPDHPLPNTLADIARTKPKHNK